MSTAEFEDKAQVNARFTASHTRGMESTIGAEETHAQSRRTPCHRGLDISTQQRSIIVSDGFNVACSVGFRSKFIFQVSCRRWLPSEWNGADFLSRDRLHQWRPPVISQHVEPLLVSNTVGVGTCLLEQATQTGSSASIGDAQSESEGEVDVSPLLVDGDSADQRSESDSGIWRRPKLRL